MGSIFSVRLPDEYNSYLRIESEKRNIPVGEILREIVGSFISGNPFVSKITDLDAQTQQKQLDVITERHRKLKNDNDYFDKHGYYPTKPRTFVESIPQSQPTNKVWTGENFNKSQTFQQDKVEANLTESDWNLVFSVLTEFDSESQSYKCIKCQKTVAQTVETTRQHLLNEHEDTVQENLRFLKQ